MNYKSTVHFIINIIIIIIINCHNIMPEPAK